MIIKGMRTMNPNTEPAYERWDVYGEVFHYEIGYIENPKTKKDEEKNSYITFKQNGEDVILKLSSYDKLFIMNNNGKTIETLRNVSK